MALKKAEVELKLSDDMVTVLNEAKTVRKLRQRFAMTVLLKQVRDRVLRDRMLLTGAGGHAGGHVLVPFLWTVYFCVASVGAWRPWERTVLLRACVCVGVM